LLASRFVDKFKILKNKDGSLSLLLIKEKNYPKFPPDSIADKKIVSEKISKVDIIFPDTEQVKLFASKVATFYNDTLVPDFFSYPGKVADMVSSGFYKTLVAVSDNREIVGGIIWHNESPKLIEFFGPYNFAISNENEIKEKLIISMIESVGKSDAIGLYSRVTTEKLPDEYFETIGELPFINNKNKKISLPVYFRQLKEDPGLIVWCDKDIKGFLEDSYKKLFLPRKIELVHNLGEMTNDYSVLSVNFIKPQDTAILQAILYGKDIEENIKEHLTLIKNEGFKNIFFEIDLGLSSQAHVISPLINNNFVPELVVPCAGTGDILIFHLENV
jgi:hypothetical protein